MRHAKRPSIHQAATLLAALTVTGCGVLGKGGLGQVACPAIGPNVDALSAQFSANAQANAKIKAFVQAAKDMAQISVQIEGEAAAACTRIAADLGVNPAQIRPGNGPGGQAEAACAAAAWAIDGVLRQGVQVRATVTPASCQANAQAHARCAGACDVNTDAECRASCQAHADVNASCTPPQFSLQVGQNAQLASRLVQTLQANLPQLLHAQISLGARLIGDAKTVAQVGAQLRGSLQSAGAQAIACIGAAAEASASASVRIEVSVRASASASGRVGVGG